MISLFQRFHTRIPQLQCPFVPTTLFATYLTDYRISVTFPLSKLVASMSATANCHESERPTLPCSTLIKLLQYGVEYPLDSNGTNGESAAAEDSSAPDDSSSVPAIVGGHGTLHAWVSMASSYTRGLIVASLQRRSHSFTYLANNEMEPPTCADFIKAAESTAATPASSSASTSTVCNPTVPWPINVHFCEFERIDWGALLRSGGGSGSKGHPGPMIVSAFPVRKGLIRKAQLSFLLRKYAAKRPASILHKTIPETHIMTIDDPEYLEEALNDVYEVRDMVPGRDMWIMKASMINRALGIHLISSVQDVERIIVDPQYEEIREWVMQRYIQQPYLLENKYKFHIRVYALAIGNLSVHIYSEMLCLIAPAEYSVQNLDRAAHITNTCANSDREGFEEEKQIKLLSEIFPPHIIESLHSQMRETVHDLFAALHSEPTVFLPVPNGFEHYGLDFLVDSSHGVYFLEANAGPDFGMTGSRLQGLVEGMMEATFELAVDRMVHAACEKEGITLPKPTSESAAAASMDRTRMKGHFIPCYEVLNSATVSMNFY